VVDTDEEYGFEFTALNVLNVKDPNECWYLRGIATKIPTKMLAAAGRQ
jgi:hypothetical protein